MIYWAWQYLKSVTLEYLPGAGLTGCLGGILCWPNTPSALRWITVWLNSSAITCRKYTGIQSNEVTVQIRISSYILHNIPLLTGDMNSINWPNAPYVWLHSLIGRASHQYGRGHGFKSHWSPDFCRLRLSNWLNLKIYCDDHSSLSSITTVQIWIIPCILHITNLIVIATDNCYNNLGMVQLGTLRGGMF